MILPLTRNHGVRLEVIDPWDGGREPGDFQLGLEFTWWKHHGGSRAGFRGFYLYLGTRALIFGNETHTDELYMAEFHLFGREWRRRRFGS